MRPELLLTTDATLVSRYRRRIIGWGLLVAVALLAAATPLYVRGIERDLERRVPDELAAAGVEGVSASFSGQQGVLQCPAPLSDPEAVLDLAHDIDGVVAVSLDRSCRVSTAPTVSPPPTAPTVPATADTAADTAVPGDPVDTSADSAVPDETGEGEPGAGPDSTTTTTATPAGFDSVGEIVRSSPRFSVLGGLVGEAGVANLLDGDEIVTVFAPDNDAFDELTADVLAELRTEPDLLASVLRHHVVAGAHPLAALEPGRLVSEHGSVLEVGRSGPDTSDLTGVTVAGASVIDGDLAAANGVIHVVDRVLLPADLELRALRGLPEFVAVLRSGAIELSGTVRSADEHARLAAAAAAAVDPRNVVDEIEIDPDAEFGGEPVDTMAALIEVVPGALTTGTGGFDRTGVFVHGTVVDAEAQARLEQVIDLGGGATPVRLELEPRPVATADDVAEVESEIDEVVSAAPLDFAPASAELAPGAAATLDVIASLAKHYAGQHVTIEGHTDSAGSDAANLALSELRAAVVYLELLARGVPADQLDFRGVGSASPVVVGGIEDRAASRRVEFVVTLQD